MAAAKRSPGIGERLKEGALLVLAGIGWVGLALLELAVRFALFLRYRNQGTTAVIWGVVFGLLVWALLYILGIGTGRSIPFAAIVAAVIGFYIYARGAGLENPPFGRPWAFHERRIRQSRRSSSP
jgi:hypothetical protein